MTIQFSSINIQWVQFVTIEGSKSSLHTRECYQADVLELSERNISFIEFSFKIKNINIMTGIIISTHAYIVMWRKWWARKSFHPNFMLETLKQHWLPFFFLWYVYLLHDTSSTIAVHKIAVYTRNADCSASWHQLSISQTVQAILKVEGATNLYLNSTYKEGGLSVRPWTVFYFSCKTSLERITQDVFIIQWSHVVIICEVSNIY